MCFWCDSPFYISCWPESGKHKAPRGSRLTECRAAEIRQEWNRRKRDCFITQLVILKTFSLVCIMLRCEWRWVSGVRCQILHPHSLTFNWAGGSYSSFCCCLLRAGLRKIYRYSETQRDSIQLKNTCDPFIYKHLQPIKKAGMNFHCSQTAWILMIFTHFHCTHTHLQTGALQMKS